MQKRFEKGGEEYQMLNDFLMLLQKHWIIEDVESDYWKCLIDDCVAFREKYVSFDEDFATRFSLTFLDYLEEKARRKNQQI